MGGSSNAFAIAVLASVLATSTVLSQSDLLSLTVSMVQPSSAVMQDFSAEMSSTPLSSFAEDSSAASVPVFSQDVLFTEESPLPPFSIELSASSAATPLLSEFLSASSDVAMSSVFTPDVVSSIVAETPTSTVVTPTVVTQTGQTETPTGTVGTQTGTVPAETPTGTTLADCLTGVCLTVQAQQQALVDTYRTAQTQYVSNVAFWRQQAESWNQIQSGCASPTTPSG